MQYIKKHFYRYVLLILLILFIVFADLLYMLLFNQYYNPYISSSLTAAALFILLLLYNIWYLRPCSNLLNIINKYYDDVVNEEAAAAIDKPKIEGHIISNTSSIPLEKIIEHYKNQANEQALLASNLKNANNLLDQNNRFANAIVEITNKILRSGNIHSILQLILDKAIEIIPNAQKGSILLYNGEYLEYKAMNGYDIESLNGFQFAYEEIYQYNANDLYSPIIINNVEEFNKNLKKEKYNKLKESRSFELKSSISCAISLNSQFYGIINIDNADNNYAFSNEDKPIIKYFAEQIGVALKNAQLMEKTLYLSQYDSLTGIYNRGYFEEQMQKIYMNAKENNKEFCFVILDLNNLKHINDNYGHEAGDKLITFFTKHIINRESKPDLFGRIGGDEFALIYLEKTKEEIAKYIDNINKYFKKVPFSYNGEDLLNITYGFGISCYPKDAEDIPSLKKLADKLMYSEKRISKEAVNMNI